MVKDKEKIPKQLKEQIISKLVEPGCVVQDLSKSYDIGKSTLYKWRYKARKKKNLSVSSADDRKFVELLVKEKPANYSEKLGLQRASLTFEDFSIFIEGKVSSSKFISILKILEA